MKYFISRSANYILPSVVKTAREAFGTAYLAVLEAIDAILPKNGVTRKQLPKSVNGYRAALRKYLAVYDGKLLREFEKLYDLLHIAGHYRALICDTQVVKDTTKVAERFIEKLGELTPSGTTFTVPSGRKRIGFPFYI